MVKRKSRSKKNRSDTLWAGEGVCHICGEPLNRMRDEIEDDHVIPLALGGEDHPRNIRPAHRACHLEKTRRDIKVIAKAKRVNKKHEGEIRAKRRPLSDPRFKKKVSGGTVIRAAEPDKWTVRKWQG
jgi:5-methylcytosine-specific restriction endonuclease McrA